MSGAEGFLSRWSRRKQESEKDRPSEPSRGPNDSEIKPVGGEGEASTVAEASEPAPAAFDPASLPPVESISGSTDIRAFLLSGVPAELTQAALRRAWVADPAICDFIGIAENQWDFTDPTGIPGFGPLTAADEISGMAGQMLAGADDGLAQIADISLPASPAAPAVGTDDLQGVAAVPSQDKAAQAAEAAGEPAATAEGDSPRRPRSHGGALPR